MSLSRNNTTTKNEDYLNNKEDLRDGDKPKIENYLKYENNKTKTKI